MPRLLFLSSWDSSVSIKISYGLDDPGFVSGLGKVFFLLASKPTQPIIYWLRGFSPGVKAAGAWDWRLYLEPRSWMNGGVLPLDAFLPWIGLTLHLPFSICCLFLFAVHVFWMKYCHVPAVATSCIERIQCSRCHDVSVLPREGRRVKFRSLVFV